MNRKLMKQMIYGGFFLAALILIFLIIYFTSLKPAPTCVDQKQNQGEEEIDCGGPCESCELRKLLPIRTTAGAWINSPKRNYSVVLVQFQNPNPSYAARSFKFDVNLYTSDGEKVYTFSNRSFVYAGQIQYWIETDVPLPASRISKSDIVISEIDWIVEEEFSLPATELRAVKTEYNAAKDQLLVTGVFSNENPYPLTRVTLNAVLYNNFSILSGLSKTLLENVEAFEERAFQIAVPALGAKAEDLGNTRVFVSAER